jgi:hypothetical protein
VIPGRRTAAGRTGVLTLVLDVIAPIALYYGLRAAGAGVYSR